MKRFFGLVIALAIVLAFSGCTTDTGTAPASSGTSTGTDSAADGAATATTYVFGISMPQLDNDGFKANLIGIQQAAEAFGDVELLVVDAQNNADTQMKQIEDFITKKVDAIVMCPVDSGALSAAVQKANEANIPVVAFDRNVSGGELTGLAESDNAAHGAKAADLMKEAAEKAGMEVSELKVLELLGAQAASAGLERHEGFSSRCEELGIEIVAALPTEFKMDNAYAAVLDAFQANGDINAIYIPSDNALYSGVESALTQIAKLVEIDQEGHIIITTVDGGPQGLNGIRNRYIDASAAQSKLIMSTEAMNIAYLAVTGQPIETSVVKIQPTPVTLDNVDDPSLWANAINK